MVRKSSIFEKLFSRKKAPVKTSPAGRGVDLKADPKAATRGAGGNGNGGRQAAKPVVDVNLRGEAKPKVKPVETKPVRKEDAQKAVVAGLSDLSSLLNGIQDQMESQGDRTSDLIGKFEDLPETARAQISFLKKISDQMDSQHTHTAQLLERFSQIPDLLGGVQRILETQQQADERRDQTLGRFRETMDRINSSINSLNQDNTKAMHENAKAMEKGQVESAKSFERSQQQTLDTFKKVQTEQTKAMTAALTGASKQNKIILVFLILAFMGMTAVFAAILSGGLG